MDLKRHLYGVFSLIKIINLRNWLFRKKTYNNKMNIEEIEIVASNVQGAGWDLTAWAMQKTLTKEKNNHSHKQSRWHLA